MANMLHGDDTEDDLEAAGQRWGTELLLELNLACTIASLVGSLVMIIPFFLYPHLRKVRHRLILGLAVNDLIQALAILIPSASAFAGREMEDNSASCRTNAFFYTSLTTAGCCWALAIAVSTYVLLVHPLSWMATVLHNKYWVPMVWCAIWIACMVNAGIGISLVEVVDSVGFCFFPLQPPHLYGNLILFIPRVFTLILSILIYIKLVLFFRRQATRAQLHEGGYVTGLNALSLQLTPGPVAVRRFFSRTETSLSTPVQGEPSHRPRTFLRNSSSTSSLSARFRAYQVARGSERKGSKDSEATLVDQRASKLHAYAKPSPTLPRIDSQQGSPRLLDASADLLASETGFTQQLPMLDELRSEKEEQAEKTPSGTAQFPVNDGYRFPPPLSPSSRPLLPRSSMNFDSSGTRSSTPIIEVSLGDAATLAPTPQDEKDMYSTVPQGTLPLADLEEEPQRPEIDTPPIDGESIGLWEALGTIAPKGEHAGHAHDEEVQRLSAADENRRVSYLMMLYPMTYALVVATSIARILSDLITGLPAAPTLQVVNRVMIMSIGAIDSMIFTFMEWRFRKTTKAASR